MIIKNARIYTPEHTFKTGDLTIRDGRIVFGAPPLEGEEVLDANGAYALPGWWIFISTVLSGMISAMPMKPVCRPLPILRPAKACWPSAPPP